uniref:Uncharacterized protein n=1 Tax=Aegilops tauschii subsp. strangulata TaxID=200361 RepID=A0A453QZP0_AEGTS
DEPSRAFPHGAILIQFSSSITRVRRWWLRPARRTRSAQDRRPAAAANSFSPLRRLAHRANPARRPRSAQGGRPATGADNSSAAFSPLRRLALRANTPLSIPHRIGIGSRSEVTMECHSKVSKAPPLAICDAQSDAESAIHTRPSPEIVLTTPHKNV